MKGLDFKGFTKVGSKDGKTTFKHKDGHWLSIAEKSLSEGYRKQLASLPSYNDETTNFAKGGEAKQPPPQPPVTPQGISKGFNGALGFKEGGKVDPSYADPLSEVQKGAVGQQVMDAVDPAVPPVSAGESQSALAQMLPQNTFSQDPLPNTPPQPSMESAQAADQTAATPTDAYSNPQGAAQSAQAGMDQGLVPATSATTARGPQATKVFLGDQAKKFEDDLNMGHIKAETYKDLFDKKDTLGKVGTLFGLLLGGAGSGLTHQPNAIMEMMNQEINRDLESQKTSATNRQNFYHLVQQNPLIDAQVKNLGANADATKYAMAQSMVTQATFHKIATTLDKMPEGPKKDQARQAAQAMYQFLGSKVNNAFDSASVMKPGVVGSPTSSSTSLNQPQSAPDPDSILAPDAANRIQGMQFDPTKAKDYDAIMKEMVGAQQFEKAIPAIKEAFYNMKDQRTFTGRAAESLGTLPYHIGEGVHAIANMDPTNRAYASNKTVLTEALGNALKNSSLTPTEIQHIVDANSTVLGDPDKLSEDKLNNIIGAAKRALPTAYLQKTGLLK